MILKELYDSYQAKRNTLLTADEFSNLLMMYPAGLVSTCDGEFDQLEKQNIYESMKEATDGNGMKTCEMYSELSYLLTDNNMHDDIMSCIKNECKNNQNAKTIINDLMVAAAESSDGVSKEESDKMEELKNTLGTA